MVLGGLGIKYRDCFVQQTIGARQCRNIRIDGQEPVRQLLEAVAPYMHSNKYLNAATILKYLASRRKRGLSRDAGGRIRRVEYSREEIEMIASVRTHPRAKSSEAICQAPNVVG